MENIIVFAIVALIVSLAVIYIRREKKKGKKCIGCPYSGSCSGGCDCSSNKEKDT